jgi:phage tail sheath protein FI
MANLVSPGVQVTVTDESVYGPAGAGTVPMLFIATGQDKVDPTGTEVDGIAKYTKSVNANKPVLVTSQRELTQYFGNIDFNKASGSVLQGDETNDYGLLAAYSFLGQSAAAYIVRADVDLTALRSASAEPTGTPANNTYWTNPAASNWGIFEKVGGVWTAVTPTVEVTSAVGAYTTTPVNGEYLVEVSNGASTTTVTYYVGEAAAWVELGTGATVAAFAPHYNVPVGAETVWVKTTRPGGGLDFDISLYTTAAGAFVAKSAVYVQATGPAGTTGDTFQDGTAATNRALAEGDIWLDVDSATASITVMRWDSIQSEWDDISTDPSVATGGFVITATTVEPTGAAADGTIWFAPEVNDLAIFEVALDGGVQKWKRVEDVQYATTAPTSDTLGGALADGDYWIDTDASGYPVIYRHNGSAWVQKDNADQSTSNGVLFADITATDTAGGAFEATLLAGAPNPLVYPTGTTGVNMCRSANTVRIYDATATTAWKWRNHASNQADGSGSFGRLAQRKVVVSAMQASASATELREETVQYRIIAAPGYPEMMDEMVTLNSDRNETAFIIVDAPFRLNPTEAITWIQGTAAIENGEAGLTTKNTYAAAYYPSVITTNPSTGDSVVAPASHSVLYTYAYSDNVSYQWFAPAGLTRGVVQNAANVGYLNSESEFVAVALTQGSRDAMYENKLNPIARFPAEGVVVWGQKSLHASASALDRVNVARLTAYLRERFAVIARPFLFEPNDAGTRANAKQVFDGFLANILQQRGIYDFAVVCDTTNNTPARIDANEFYIDVAVEPTKAAEFIYIPIRILNTGEIAG